MRKKTFIAFIDFETTGLDTEKDAPLEFCAIVYDTHMQRYMKSFEGFFNPTMTQETKALANDLCQIDTDIIEPFRDSGAAFLAFCKLIEDGVVTHLVAHNAPFDRAFFDKACKRYLKSELKISWIDSMTDFPFRDGIQAKSLKYLAADHGILAPLAHRALGDCLTLMLITQQYEWAEIAAYAAIPTVRLHGQAPFEKNDLMKESGFKWFPVEKKWIKITKKTYENISELNFQFPVSELK